MYLPQPKFSYKYSVNVLADIGHLQTIYIYAFIYTCIYTHTYITAFYNRLLEER